MISRLHCADDSVCSRLPQFLHYLEKSAAVKEWLITPSTTDEVFMKVAQLSDDVEEVAREIQEDMARKRLYRDIKLCCVCHRRVAERVGCCVVVAADFCV